MQYFRDRASTCSFRRRPLFASTWLLLGVGLFALAVTTIAVAQEHGPQIPAGQAPTSGSLLELVRGAVGDFQPVTNESLAEAAEEFTARARELAEFVGPDGNGEAWRHYLGWPKLEQFFVAAGQERAAPAFGELARMYRDVRRRLNGGEVGVELPPFRRAMRGLQHFYNVSLAAQLQDNPAAYERQLDQLAEAVEKYQATPTGRAETELGNRLGVITSLGYSPDVVGAVRERFHQPNVFLEVSTKFVNRAAAEPINERDCVSDCILGTSIRGTSQTSGMVSVRPIPSADRALLEFVSQGQSTSRTTGTNGPAVIRSSGTTNFVATKRVEFTDSAFRLLPARADAHVNTRIRSVGTSRRGLFSGIISNMARDRAQESKPRAEAIAARHAEDRIRSEFNEDLLEEVTDMRRQYRDDFRLPMQRYGELPKQIHFSSSDSSVAVQMLQVNFEQIAASSSPPPAPMGHDMVARIHQTAVNNYFAMFLAGATLSEISPDIDPEIDAKIPEWVEDMLDELGEDEAESDDGPQLAEETTAADAVEDSDYEPWSIRFRSVRPVSVVFNDGQATVIVHAAEFKYGDRSFRNWDLVASFDLQVEDGGLLLTRGTDVEMFPSSVDFEAGQRVPNRLLPERSNLNKAINDLDEQGDGIPERVETEPLEFTGDLSDVGTAWLEHAESADGWLTLGWSLP